MKKWMWIVAGVVAVCMFQGCSKPHESSQTKTYDVVITAVADGWKIRAIKAVREVTGLGLKDAKDLVEKVPSVVKVTSSRDDAETIASKLRESSLTVEIKER